jgi:hypothetical protein
MKIITVLQASAVRFFVPSGPYGFLPDVIQALKERYAFVSAEIIPADPNQGNVFRVGKLTYAERDINISELHVYHLGAAVMTISDTNDSEIVLDDLLAWASSRFKVTFSEHGKRAYSSQLEFELRRPLPDYFPHLKPIGISMSRLLPDFWPVKPLYEVSSVSFSFDPSIRLAGLGNIRIERREGIPYDANLYFSEAPLRTKDHIAVLEAFETSIS